MVTCGEKKGDATGRKIDSVAGTRRGSVPPHVMTAATLPSTKGRHDNYENKLTI
jgi:hypothetical protein